MRIAFIIKRLDEMRDQVKYHGVVVDDLPHFLEDLSDELRSIGADEIIEARASGTENGFNYARKLVLQNILQNPTLKTRGEMITALEDLNGETVLRDTKETKTEKSSGERSVRDGDSVPAGQNG